ncbi:MAG: 3-oxoacyl-[acyl-carrier-protein] synthase III C-terminal domain-containing protein [Myxococcota bacterium]
MNYGSIPHVEKPNSRSGAANEAYGRLVRRCRGLLSPVTQYSAHIVSVGRAFPPHHYAQEELVAAFVDHWGQHFHNPRRLDEIHRNVLVGSRYLALPVEEYLKLNSFDEANAAYRRVATDVGEAAVRDALERAGLGPKDVDHIFFVSVTGVATPSIDARLVNRVGFRPDVKRTPIFGLGCVAGAAGTARAADYLHGHPDEVAVLLSVELCSLTLQRRDLSMANVISAGLFGDGAAAVVLTGRDHPLRGPRVLDSRATFYPDTEHVMGWDIGADGFRVVLSPDVPTMARENLGRDVERFLAQYHLQVSDIDVWINHTGGPKVLHAVADALELPEGALDRSWKSLREVGNVSSTSVLLVLGDALAEPAAGSRALMFAMGPGFCSELVLIDWVVS